MYLRDWDPATCSGPPERTVSEEMAFRLWCGYFYDCESYDTAHCHCKDARQQPTPTRKEQGLISSHARRSFLLIKEIAYAAGIKPYVFFGGRIEAGCCKHEGWEKALELNQGGLEEVITEKV